MVLKRSTKEEIVNLRLIGRLSIALIEKDFVHALPTILLLRAHHRVELAHLLNPKDKLLQKAHTHIFLEMELRDIEHLDTDPDFFQPSNLKWPYEFEFDDPVQFEIEKERLKRKSNRNTVVSRGSTGRRTSTGRTTSRTSTTNEASSPSRTNPGRRTSSVSTTSSRKRESNRKKVRFRRSVPEKSEKFRVFRRKKFKSNIQKGFVGPIQTHTHEVFLQVVKELWDIQPLTGNIPIDVGPRPRKELWFRSLEGANEHENWLRFMSLSLLSLYRSRVPPWGIQEWDIELTVTNAGGSDTIEKRKFINTRIDPKISVINLEGMDFFQRPDLRTFFNPFVELSRNKSGSLRKGGRAKTVEF